MMDLKDIRFSTVKRTLRKSISGPQDVRLLNRMDYITIPRIPRTICPYCGKENVPEPLNIYSLKGKECTMAVYCHECAHLYLLSTGNYSSPRAKWNIQTLNRTVVVFSDIIIQISEQFCDVYNEAIYTFDLKLMNICGIGFRKSLEYLIKDYCIHLHPDMKSRIVVDDLGKCISEYIDSEFVRDIASRAVWLGNDQSHYEKRWIEKDISDLIGVISLLCDAIEQEEKRRELVSEMPEQKKKKALK